MCVTCSPRSFSKAESRSSFPERTALSLNLPQITIQLKLQRLLEHDDWLGLLGYFFICHLVTVRLNKTLASIS